MLGIEEVKPKPDLQGGLKGALDELSAEELKEREAKEREEEELEEEEHAHHRKHIQEV